MKKVLSSSSEVAHFWANEVQEEGRSGNVFFRGKSIFSYGEHFEMARIVGHGRKKAVLYNDRAYSPSTSKHQSYVRRAIPEGMKVLYVKYISDNFDRYNLEQYAEQITSHIDKAKRAHSPEHELQQARNVQSLAVDYVKFFGKAIPKDLREKIKPRNFEKLAKKLTEKAEQRATLRAKKEAKFRALTPEQMEIELAKKRHSKEVAKENKNREAIRKFHDFESYGIESSSRSRYRWNAPPDYTYLRFNAGTDNVETSKGVKIPRPVALRLYSNIQKLGSKMNGREFLQFHITEVSPEFLVIGCHRIPMDEVKSVAESLPKGE